MSDVLFGLDIPTSAGAGDDPVAEAVNAEALGFDFVSSSDHPCGDSPSFETWTMLNWMAANTSRIRIASRVLGVPYRSPAMVAKMAESLQRLSNGRLILGLGGGASDNEFRAFGLTVPSPRDKVDGLAEAIEIARGLWSQETFTYPGRLYHTDGAQIEPKPATPIPIWLGTFGPRSLTMTGRLADGWIPSLAMAPPEQVPAMREHILAGAREAGRDLDGFTYALNMEIRIEEHADIPGGVTGRADAVTEQLVGLVRLGFTALNFKPRGPDRREQVERLARQVIPAVRSAVA